MNPTIYERNYRIMDRLLKSAGGIAQFLQRENAHIKMENKPFMDFVIQRIAPDVLSIAHYYEQNEDLVPDPEMTVRVFPEIKMMEALTYLNLYERQQVYIESGDGRLINYKGKKELNQFLSLWLKNLIGQGFPEKAKIISSIGGNL